MLYLLSLIAMAAIMAPGLTRLLVEATRERMVRINWPLAERTLLEARGVPVAVSLPLGTKKTPR